MALVLVSSILTFSPFCFLPFLPFTIDNEVAEQLEAKRKAGHVSLKEINIFILGRIVCQPNCLPAELQHSPRAERITICYDFVSPYGQLLTICIQLRVS